ncbi:MAG: ECF transporter S component [bacterium]
MKAQFITRTAVLAAITLAIQALGLPPQCRGPALNAMLLLSTIFVGPAAGLLMGVLAPWVALAWELMSPVLAPALPFLVLANAAYVLLFAWLSPLAGRYAALLAGGIGKYAILAGGVNFLLHLPRPLAATLVTPELFAALLGGAVALVIVQLLANVVVGSEFVLGRKVKNHDR